MGDETPLIGLTWRDVIDVERMKLIATSLNPHSLKRLSWRELDEAIYSNDPTCSGRLKYRPLIEVPRMTLIAGDN